MDYVYDAAGKQVAEVNSSGGLNRLEAYAGGKHLATYTNGVIYFNHADWLGTERMRTTASGAGCETITSLAFGDGMATSGSCSDASPMHFTGKQRDEESGLDYFGARYNASALGRFMTPDWSAKPTAVPYAEFGGPQSLNLYTYVRNNPVSAIDRDGHYMFNASGCEQGNKKCQKQWDKAEHKFETRVAKDLQSKNAAIRAAAAAYGAPGEANSVNVGFAHLLSSQGDYGSTDPRLSGGGLKNVQVTLDFSRAGNAETITHEGTHVVDDMKFLNSFNPLTQGYNQDLNITHGQTEFNAFKAGAAVDQERGFGPNDDQKIWDFLRSSSYAPYLNVPVFDPGRYPAGGPFPSMPQPAPVIPGGGD